jgi:hypothetical protein
MIAGLFPHQQSRTVRENIVYEADLRNPVSSQIGIVQTWGAAQICHVFTAQMRIIIHCNWGTPSSDKDIQHFLQKCRTCTLLTRQIEAKKEQKTAADAERMQLKQVH